MPNKEPWFKPRRDEDEDEKLINQLNQRDPRYDRQRRAGNGRNGGGCALLILAGSGVVAALASAAAAVQHFI